MDLFQISEKFQSELLLFIKAIMKKLSLVTFLPFVKDVKILIFTESAPRPIQSSSRHVHYKDKGLKWLCSIYVCGGQNN